MHVYAIIIHKLYKSKTLQKTVYKNYINPITKMFDYETFSKNINEENLDIKNLVVKDEMLKYN